MVDSSAALDTQIIDAVRHPQLNTWFWMLCLYAKPLKSLCWIAIHGYYIDVIESDAFKLASERVDPSWVMVTDCDAL
jgi:hypothetical protein